MWNVNPQILWFKILLCAPTLMIANHNVVVSRNIKAVTNANIELSVDKRSFPIITALLIVISRFASARARPLDWIRKIIFFIHPPVHLPPSPVQLEILRSDEHSFPGRTVKVADALDRAVVLALLSVKLDPDPGAGRERRLSDEGHQSRQITRPHLWKLLKIRKTIELGQE